MQKQSGPGQGPSVHSRACENCRARKTRCDKKLPCSNCRMLDVACQPAVKPNEHRPRIIVSTQYERQIQLIQERLTSIEQSLRHETPASGPSSDGTLLTTPASRYDSPSTIATTPGFEGDSSFSTSTFQASHAADLTAATVAEDYSLNDIAIALDSLKTSLHARQAPRLDENKLARSKPRRRHSESRLPPAAFCAAIVKRIKRERPCLFIACRSYHGYENLERLCQGLYFPSTQLTPGSLALAYGLLYFILRDLVAEHLPELEQYDCAAYLDLFEENFATALSEFESVMVPTLESVQALLLGVFKSQEESKLSLCWMYLGAAHSMCQALGLHRKCNVQNDPYPLAETKRNTFWTLYWSDKTLSVNLGRASRFQDYDIDIELFAPSNDLKQRPWDLLNIAFIKLSRITGQVYDRLYSPGAAAALQRQQEAAVEELAADVMAYRAELLSVDMTNACFRGLTDLLFSYIDSICYSLLSLIYRAQVSSSTATRVSARCYEAARLSLSAHLKCYEHLGTIENVNERKEWVMWAMLYPCFMPFLIVFTHAIASLNPSDVGMLRATVDFLEATSYLGDGTARLYEICKVFLNTAEVLIESRRRTSKVQFNDDGSLLLPPFTGQTAPTVMPDLSGLEESANFDMSDANMSNFLSGWLVTNRPVTDMLNLEWNEPEIP